MNMSDETFIREVDEELQRDRLVGFWTRWGRMLVAGVVLVLLAWGGWLYWSHRQDEARGVESEKLAAALDVLTGGGAGDTAAPLNELAKSDSPGMRAVALMTQANVALSKNDTKFATETYDKVASDQSLSQEWRDLALIRKTALEFDTVKPEEVVARLKPLAVSGKAWFGSAGEMTALAYARMGKGDLAAKMFADMAKDEKVPESIRGRARAMSTSLEPGGAAAAPAAEPAKEKTP